MLIPIYSFNRAPGLGPGGDRKPLDCIPISRLVSTGRDVNQRGERETRVEFCASLKPRGQSLCSPAVRETVEGRG